MIHSTDTAFHATPEEEAVLTNSISLTHLMVNVPQSEAPSPENIRPGNDEWTPELFEPGVECSLERR